MLARSAKFSDGSKRRRVKNVIFEFLSDILIQFSGNDVNVSYREEIGKT
jgi:hypothetical protein